jgi:hypothetical protein
VRRYVVREAACGDVSTVGSVAWCRSFAGGRGVTTDEILAVLIGVLIGVVVAIKIIAWLMIAAGKLLMSWIHKAMI